MTEAVFFCAVIFAVLTFGIYGITNAYKNKSFGFSRQNTDSVRGL